MSDIIDDIFLDLKILRSDHADCSVRLGLQMIKAINTVKELYPEADLAMRIGELLEMIGDDDGDGDGDGNIDGDGDDDVNDDRIGEIFMLMLITGDSDENNIDHDEGERALTIGYKYPLVVPRAVCSRSYCRAQFTL